jgi:diguanylate cyclase (GGDEF)-like protein
MYGPPPHPARRLPWRIALAAGGVATVVLVYWVDVAVEGLPVTNAYLVPIAAVSWTVGIEAGLGVSAVATALAYAAAPGLGLLGGLVMPALLNIATAATVGLLRRAYAHERYLARTDTVTGAANRRAFEERARAALRLHTRQGRPLTAVVIDLDGFKGVNDTLGHDEGDEVLRLVASTLARSVRTTDIVARYGGDEFGVLFVDTGVDGAPALLARLHEALDEAMRRRGWPITFSIGAITFARAPRSERELMRLVDAQMYAAKHGGKDRLVHVVHGRVAPAV